MSYYPEPDSHIKDQSSIKFAKLCYYKGIRTCYRC